MKHYVLYVLLVILGILAIVGWQQSHVLADESQPTWKVFDTIEDVPRISIIGFSPDICLWVAQMYQEGRLKEGYITNIAVAWNGYYDGIYVTDVPGAHAGLLVETKQGWYFIDLEGWRTTKLFEARQ